MKKILSIVLTVVMLGALLASAIPVFAADSASDKLQIVAETINAEPGDTVELKIDLKNVAAVSNVASAGLTVTWDSKLTFVTAEYGAVKDVPSSLVYIPVHTEIIEGEEEEVESWDGVTGTSFKFNWAAQNPSSTNCLKTDATYVTITFTVANDAEAGKLLPVTVTAQDGSVYNRKMEDVEFEIVNGGVQMPAAAATATLKNSSYDELFYDSTSILDTKVELKIRDLEDKSILDFTEGAVSTITVRGWAWVNDSEIDVFGYSIDGATPVYSASFLQDRTDVYGQAGATQATANGFFVTAPVGDLKEGQHTIDVYVKAKDGTEIKVIKDRGTTGVFQVGVTFNVTKEAGPTVQVITDSAAAMAIDASNGVALSMNGKNLVATTTDGTDPWVSVALPELDISGYTSFTIKYKASATISTNQVYLKDTTVNPGYSPATGTWTTNKMGPTAEFTTVSYEFKTALSAMVGTKLTGIRIPTCSVTDGVFEIESITFDKAPAPSISITWYDVSRVDNGTQVLFNGWTGASYPITAFGYTVDGGEPIFASVTLKGAEQQVKDIAGENAARFEALIDCSGLEVGTHTIALVAQLADEDETVIPLGIASNNTTVVPGATDKLEVEIKDDSLKVTAVDKTAKAGKTVKVGIKLADVVALASLKVRVTWPEELVLTKVEYKCLNTNDPKAIIHEVEDWSTVKGAYTFNWIQSEAEYQLTEDKNFVTLTFKVPEGAEAGTKYDIEIDVIADDAFYYNDNGVETDIAKITQKNGSVTVVEAKLHSMSFNTVWVDGTQVCDVEKALDFLAQNPIKGDVKEIGLRGWARVENCKLVSFGYRIDNGEPVFDAAYTEPRTDVYNAFNVTSEVADGFKVTGIDVSGVSSGEHTITILVKVDDNDQVFEVVEVPFEIVRPSKLHAMSFNTVTVDGTQVCDIDNALGFLAEKPIKGDVSTIDLRGWAWIDESTIESFGYKIDNGEAVFNTAFIQNRPDVYAQDGATQATANGFNVTGIDVSNVAPGEHTITILVKAADGNEITVVEVPFTKTSALLNVSYDELKYDDTQKFSESVDKKIAALEDTSVLDFAMGDVKTITVRGWARVSEDVNDIAGFGYSIDGGEVVTGDFIENRAAELANANFPGAQGFKVVVPVEDLDHGEHSIDVYLITKAGKQIKVVKDRSTADEAIFNQVGVTFTVTKHEGQGDDNPGTADVAVIAIAAVSVVALAGAFIGKKALKK